MNTSNLKSLLSVGALVFVVMFMSNPVQAQCIHQGQAFDCKGLPEGTSSVHFNPDGTITLSTGGVVPGNFFDTPFVANIPQVIVPVIPTTQQTGPTALFPTTIDGQNTLTFMSSEPRIGQTYDLFGNGKAKKYAFGAGYRNVEVPERDYYTGEIYDTTPTASQDTYQKEFLGGIDFEVARSVSLGVRYIHRSIPRLLDDTGTFDTIDTTPMTETVHTYDSAEITLNRNFSDNWGLVHSYRWGGLKGNFDGFFRADEGPSDPAITSLFDFPQRDLDNILWQERELLTWTDRDWEGLGEAGESMKGALATGNLAGIGQRYDPGSPDKGYYPIWKESKPVRYAAGFKSAEQADLEKIVDQMDIEAAPIPDLPTKVDAPELPPVELSPPSQSVPHNYDPSQVM